MFLNMCPFYLSECTAYEAYDESQDTTENKASCGRGLPTGYENKYLAKIHWQLVVQSKVMLIIIWK